MFGLAIRRMRVHLGNSFKDLLLRKHVFWKLRTLCQTWVGIGKKIPFELPQEIKMMIQATPTSLTSRGSDGLA